jgi:hypothetical protein
LEGGESDLTNAMIWYFGKQSYSFSKGFIDLFAPGESIAEPCDAEFINDLGVIQSNNSKGRLKRIEVFPIIRRSLLPKHTQLCIDNWDIPPDPPPETVHVLEKMALDCKPVKWNKKELEDGSVIDIIVYENPEVY